MQNIPASLIDIEAAAAALEMSPTLAWAYIASQGDHPVATYKGRDLWLSDSVHDLLAERGDVAVLAERAARDAFERTEAELHGTVAA
jgi:hypothetical protein